MKNASPVLMRSALYVPGSNPRALAKARELDADVHIYDLEDSVAPEMKAESRRHVTDALRSARPGSTLRTVRINAMATSLWQADLESVLVGQPDALVVPKVNSGQELTALVNFLQDWEKRTQSSVVPGIWPMIESPMGVLNAYEIATANRVTGLVMGTSDLAKALRVPNTPRREGLLLALQQCVLAARAAGVIILDGVYIDIRGEEAFISQCQDGVRMGFDGKTVIHPSQVAGANRAFLPTQLEVDQARARLDGWRKASARGEEICMVDGHLVERLHAEDAERVLALWDEAQKHLRKQSL
uniref:Putative Citrate lyase beta subunit n=1 Tax=Magnetococcus massalia (strain MO-1) TaxID=451514 RepID=A0A1S7LIA2_MAGMO|nr:putative Citrate lyase beta subunit [Candidatus Magnetococcus massalia]